MTHLESILSNLVHFPMKLSGVTIPEISFLTADSTPPTFSFNFEAVPDYKYFEKTDGVFIPDDDIPFCDLDCDCCDFCDGYPGGEPSMWGIPDVDYIIFNNPATIVFWEDGTKTVVKCMEGEKFEKYAGFAMACIKKLFGSTSRAKAIMNELSEDQKEKEKKHETPAE